VPRLIGAALSNNVATLHELQTVYSIEDVYNLLEVVNVDAHNQKILSKRES
jgi:hypothetical protein